MKKDRTEGLSMRRCMKLLTFVLGSFTGGFSAILFLNYMSRIGSPVAIPVAADATSIANTYIVFTTFIFVGFTVVLGMAGYVFTQQFTSHREAQERQAISDLQGRLEKDGELAIDLLKSTLENEEAIAFLQGALQAKINQVLDARLEDINATAGEAQKNLDELHRRRLLTEALSANLHGQRGASVTARNGVNRTVEVRKELAQHHSAADRRPG